MAERFTLSADGTAVPYVPAIHDAPKSPDGPKSHFKAGDRVQLAGIVEEVIHTQGPYFNVRVRVDNGTLWLQQEHLIAADAAARQEGLAQIIAQTAKQAQEDEAEEEKHLAKPPATRAVSRPKETK